MQRGFLAGVVGGAVTVVTVAGVATWLLAARNEQHTTVDPTARGPRVEVDGRPAVDRFVLEARIQGWYHPLPWVGRSIHDVSCAAPLKAVVGATGMCTARSDGERVAIPVRVLRVEGDPDTPRVTWLFER
ncbi:DUF4333 domain-containing protein [Streptomyces sp. NPDC008159]|uniref:DUF4333 domain-containing protein n=1 Tax=Streptomyces sp. NPDC008159 TaxID=3364817 RepID=UPI0036EBD993